MKGNSQFGLNVFKQFLAPYTCTRKKQPVKGVEPPNKGLFSNAHLLRGHGEFWTREKLQRCKYSSEVKQGISTQTAESGPPGVKCVNVTTRKGCPRCSCLCVFHHGSRLVMAFTFLSQWKIFCFSDFLSLLEHRILTFHGRQLL